MSLEKVCKDIKTLKIQGASKIAKVAIIAMQKEISRSKAKTKNKLLAEAKDTKEKLMVFRLRNIELGKL